MRALYPEYKRNFEEALRDEKALVVLGEIGYEHMTSATSFVLYIHEKYGVSESTIWYTLKKLKKLGLLEFGSRGEGKALELTKEGIGAFRGMIAVNVRAYAPGYGVGIVRGVARG